MNIVALYSAFNLRPFHNHLEQSEKFLSSLMKFNLKQVDFAMVCILIIHTIMGFIENTYTLSWDLLKIPRQSPPKFTTSNNIYLTH